MCDCRYGYGRFWALTAPSQCRTRTLGLAVTFCDGASTQFDARNFMHVYRSEMEQAEAASRNETRALPNNNFVIARLVISIGARILCHIISLVHKSLCFC